MATVTVNFHTVALAAWFASPEGPATLAGNVNVQADGAVVAFDDAGLTHLADLDEEADGHYDGQHIWIGGTEYAVVRKTGRPSVGPRTTIRLPQADYDALDARAAALGTDRSALVRRYVTAGLHRAVFTVQVEAGDGAGPLLASAAPAETVEAAGGETANDIAEWTARNQTVAEGTSWRVRVWAGVGTSGEPDAVFVPEWTAEVDVVSGTIEIANQAGDAPIIGGALTSGTTIEPWGVEEHGMDRADEALEDLGLVRCGDWTRELNDQLWACRVEASPERGD